MTLFDKTHRSEDGQHAYNPARVKEFSKPLVIYSENQNDAGEYPDHVVLLSPLRYLKRLALSREARCG